MDLCVFNRDGEVVRHRPMKAAPEPFLKAIAPYREDLVVGVACLFTWDWLADLCTQEGIPFVLGHALSMQAIHGGKAQNETLEAHTIAGLLRGGRRPQASGSPAERRATRDVRRRRRHRRRKRAELLAHIQHTNRQDNLPELGKKLAYKANRAGVAPRFPDPAVQKSLAVDLTLIDSDDRWLTDRERDLVRTAKAHEAQPFYRLRSIPGIGKILALVRLDELHDIRRVPRGQACVSSGRLVTCAKESTGTRDGTAGKKLGQADRKGAFSEAAVLFLRNHPAGQKSLARFAKTQGKGQALTVLAHQVARAVYSMLTRETVFARDKLFNESRRGARAPDASLDADGISLRTVLWHG